jgi:hypothetical protein
MEKSHVGLGHDLCPVCGIEHNETILLDRRFRKTLDHDNFTGWSLCPEHAAQRDAGFVFLVELREQAVGDLKSTWSFRTGLHIAIHASAARDVFGQEPALLSFCTPEVTTALQAMQESTIEQPT